MTDAEDWFIDTNVLIYASQTRSPWHAKAEAALHHAQSGAAARWVSGQILREYLATVSSPQPDHGPVPMAEAIQRVRFLAQRFDIAEDGPEVRQHLLALLGTYPVAGRQVHDANIVATMPANGISRLLSFNVGDFRCFAPVVTIEAPA